jgi:multicomponent Na+:H+ antiporter subunit G
MNALAMIQTGVVGVLLALGCLFVIVAAVGIVRLPDFYSRMHATGKSDTLGQSLILLALVVHEGLTMVSAKLLLILVFIMIANPTATHAVARAAYVVGKQPWKKGDKRR